MTSTQSGSARVAIIAGEAENSSHASITSAAALIPEAIGAAGTGTGLGPYIVAVPAASGASSAANLPVPNAPPEPSAAVNMTAPDCGTYDDRDYLWDKG